MAKGDQDDDKAWWADKSAKAEARRKPAAKLPEKERRPAPPSTGDRPEPVEERKPTKVLPFLVAMVVVATVIYYFVHDRPAEKEATTPSAAAPPPLQPKTSTGAAQPTRPPSPTAHDTTAAAKKVVNGLVADLRQRNYDAAYGWMASAYREVSSLSSFRAAVEANPYLAHVVQIDVHSTQITGGAGRLEGGLKTGRGDVIAVFHVVRENDKWHVTTVVVAGVPTIGVGVAPSASDRRPDAGTPPRTAASPK